MTFYIDNLKKTIDSIEGEYLQEIKEKRILLTALEEIESMRIECPADIAEVKLIARKAINECD